MELVDGTLESLIEPEDIVKVLLAENTRLTHENAELKVVVEKLLSYIDGNDIGATEGSSEGVPKHNGV